MQKHEKKQNQNQNKNHATRLIYFIPHTKSLTRDGIITIVTVSPLASCIVVQSSGR